MRRLSETQSSLLPKGMAVLLPEAAARQRAIERTALSVFRLWGYREVIPPMFEYLDVLSKGLEPELVEKSYKFVDRSNGRIMILRPDVTPQIARMVALLMSSQPKPIRLCYSANVFRYEEEHAGREREILQIGGELIGPQDAEADAEIIAVAVELLKQFGLDQFRIAIGQIGFFKGLLQEMGVSEKDHLQIQKAVAGRDVARLVQILEGLALDHKNIQKIVGLLELFGQGEVFRRARKLVELSSRPAITDRSGRRASLNALARLEEVYLLLKKYGISDKLLVDLSEVRGFGYYSGLVFEVFAEGVGYELGGGGRYDHLIAHFGEDLPSTGFALHVERVQRALDHQLRGGKVPVYQQVGADVLVIDGEEDPDTALQLCGALRQKGLTVIRRVILEEDLASCVEQSRCLNIRHTIVLNPGSLAKGRGMAKELKARDGVQALWINVKTGEKRQIKKGRLFKLAENILSVKSKTG